MIWQVIYHHEVADDLKELGKYQARTILRTIETRIRDGEPEKPVNRLQDNWRDAAASEPGISAKSTAFKLT